MKSGALRKPEQLYVAPHVVVVLRGKHFNLNLRDYYEQHFGPWQGEQVEFFLAPGCRILSRSTDEPACRTGLWRLP